MRSVPSPLLHTSTSAPASPPKVSAPGPPTIQSAPPPPFSVLAMLLPTRLSLPAPPVTFSMKATPVVPVAAPEVRLTLRCREELTANGAARERRRVDVHVGAAAQEGRLVHAGQRQTSCGEREAGPGRYERGHAGEVDDDRPVHADRRLVNMKAGHVSRRQARHGHDDVERARGDAVVGDRRRGRGRRAWSGDSPGRRQASRSTRWCRARGWRGSRSSTPRSRCVSMPTPPSIAPRRLMPSPSTIESLPSPAAMLMMPVVEEIVWSPATVVSKSESLLKPGSPGEAVVTEQPARLRDRQGVAGRVSPIIVAVEPTTVDVYAAKTAAGLVRNNRTATRAIVRAGHRVLIDHSKVAMMGRRKERSLPQRFRSGSSNLPPDSQLDCSGTWRRTRRPAAAIDAISSRACWPRRVFSPSC